VSSFLSHLATEKHVAASTQNQAASALIFLYREVLGQPLPWLDEVQKAKKPARLPVVFSRDEARSILARLDGSKWLMASFLCGAGLRLMECLRLRVKDVDFGSNQLTIRDGKGGKVRVRMLPQSLKEPLILHLARVGTLHGQDLKEGFGTVHLPFGLERNCRHANREWGWQYVFPVARRSIARAPGAGSGTT
jgi:integrase